LREPESSVWWLTITKALGGDGGLKSGVAGVGPSRNWEARCLISSSFSWAAIASMVAARSRGRKSCKSGSLRGGV